MTLSGYAVHILWELNGTPVSNFWFSRNELQNG
jgi:hypothetical protein